MSGTTTPVDASSITTYVDSAGIHAPAYSDILTWLQTQYQGIYGTDAVLTNDTQDGQWLGILASVINDCNNSCVAAYNNFSPQTAQGAGLSSIVKINGLTRNAPTNSTVSVTIGGTVESTINNGIITDSNQNQWTLPAQVVIPSGGTIVVTATCTTPGAITAIAQTFGIANPQQGWQSAVSANPAVPGQPVESDGALRIRQTASTVDDQETVLAGLSGNLLQLAGVTRLNIVENDTSSTNSDGVPANSIAVVIEGGNTADIGNVIIHDKSPGCGTYGSISYTETDDFGNNQTVYFSNPTEVTITVVVNLLASTIPGGGYTTTIGAQIQAAIAAYIIALPIGGDVYFNRLMLPAMLNGGLGSSTYAIESILIARSGSPAAADVTIAYNEAATCTTSNVTINAS